MDSGSQRPFMPTKSIHAWDFVPPRRASERPLHLRTICRSGPGGCGTHQGETGQSIWKPSAQRADREYSVGRNQQDTVRARCRQGQPAFQSRRTLQAWLVAMRLCRARWLWCAERKDDFVCAQCLPNIVMLPCVTRSIAQAGASSEVCWADRCSVARPRGGVEPAYDSRTGAS